MQKSTILESKKSIIIYFALIISLGLGIRFWYFPLDVPIASDGFASFVYSMKTVFDASLPAKHLDDKDCTARPREVRR